MKHPTLLPQFSESLITAFSFLISHWTEQGLRIVGNRKKKSEAETVRERVEEKERNCRGKDTEKRSREEWNEGKEIRYFFYFSSTL